MSSGNRTPRRSGGTPFKEAGRFVINHPILSASAGVLTAVLGYKVAKQNTVVENVLKAVGESAVSAVQKDFGGMIPPIDMTLLGMPKACQPDQDDGGGKTSKRTIERAADSPAPKRAKDDEGDSPSRPSGRLRSRKSTDEEIRALIGRRIEVPAKYFSPQANHLTKPYVGTITSANCADRTVEAEFEDGTTHELNATTSAFPSYLVDVNVETDSIDEAAATAAAEAQAVARAEAEAAAKAEAEAEAKAAQEAASKATEAADAAEVQAAPAEEASAPAEN